MSDSGRVIGDGRYAGPSSELRELPEKFAFDPNDVPNSMYIRCVYCGYRNLRGNNEVIPDCSDKKGHYFRLPDAEREKITKWQEERRDTQVAQIERLEAVHQQREQMTHSELYAQNALRDLIVLLGVGQLPKESIENTPARFVKALTEMVGGYSSSPEEILGKVFEDECDEVVILRGISFSSVCEHHLLPFTGTADVGYIPGKVVGLSKLARLVDCFARRFQMQERMTRQIAESLITYLGAKGAAVVTRASHSCMACRGVKKEGAEMVCSSMLGVFREEPSARAEFLSLCR